MKAMVMSMMMERAHDDEDVHDDQYDDDDQFENDNRDGDGDDRSS